MNLTMPTVKKIKQMRGAIVTMGKLLSPLLVILRNKIHQCYEMRGRPLDDTTEGTQSVSTVISTLICDMQFPLWYLLWYAVSSVISSAICNMQFLLTVICTDAIVPLAAGGGGAVRSNLKIGIFIGEKRRRPFGQIRPRCSTVPTSLVQGTRLLASATLETLSPYHQQHMWAWLWKWSAASESSLLVNCGGVLWSSIYNCAQCIATSPPTIYFRAQCLFLCLCVRLPVFLCAFVFDFVRCGLVRCVATIPALIYIPMPSPRPLWPMVQPQIGLAGEATIHCVTCLVGSWLVGW